SHARSDRAIVGSPAPRPASGGRKHPGASLISPSPQPTRTIMQKTLSHLKRALLSVRTAVAVSVLAATCTVPAQAQDTTPVRLRLDWTTLGYHAPFYYGVAKGIYERAGIKLSIEEGKGSASVAQLTASDSDDFGFSDAT